MKKTLALILALLMVFSLFACAKKEGEKESAPASEANTAPPETKDASQISTHTETADLTASETKVHPSDTATFRAASQAGIGYMTQIGNAFGASGNASLFFGECLLRWNSDTNEVDPFLAESYEWVNDKTLRLHLRKDITSILGDPVTASDVIYTWAWGHETTALNQYYSIFDYDNTKAVDDYTVDIALKNTYPFLPLDLAHYAYSIVCEASVNKIGSKEATQYNPNAQTGPYKFTKFDEAAQVVYAERRDDYWGLPPYYKYIELRSVPDANARAMGVEAGDFNFVMNPAAASVDAADGKTSKGWYIPAAGRFVKFLMNSDREPLNIKEVRQAIALGINYEALLKVAAGGNGIISDSACYSPLNTLAYTKPGDPNNCFLGRYDPELAKEKLKEAGYPDGFKLSLSYTSGNTIVATACELIRNNLGQLGIEISLDLYDSAAISTITRSGEFDVYVQISGNPNPKRAINSLDGTRQSHADVSGSAGANWAPAGIEDVIDRCIQTVDDDARMAAFAEFNDICREYVPMIILFCPYVTFLTSPDIVNMPIGSQGGPEFCRIFPAEYLEG